MEEFINNAPFLLVVLTLILGFAFLIKGADVFVGGASAIAKKFNVPPVVIGLTVVAMGTSLPETSVSVSASLANNNALAISNAVGSNIFNLIVVIGVCSILCKVPVGVETIKRDIPFSAICALLLLALGMVGAFDESSMTLGHVDGAILLVIFTVYIIKLVKTTLRQMKNGESVAEDVEGITDLPVPKAIVFVLFGGAFIALGGDITVESAARIATDLGMSQTLVGLTICSIGTSLPELVTSIVAAKKKQIGMALGNAIGSNIFNILMVLGIASAISPIGVNMLNIIDIVILLACTLLVWLLAKKKELKTVDGIIMLCIYIAYVVYICLR